ncbi:MAG: hypothetical protein K2I66_03045 [Bacteroidales bacterium]|nr:hypothetical protein [Bacteroidales bacterium]
MENNRKDEHPVEDLSVSVREYLSKRWDAIKLGGVEGISVFVSRFVALSLSFLAFTVAFLFLGFALSYCIGHALNSDVWGFAIVGGAFLIGGLLLYLLRKRFMVNALVRFFVKLFFNGTR